ncbi:LOW QUALITY PROTEIN: hypothetical protein HID58_045750, partial [Brassica napus]
EDQRMAIQYVTHSDDTERRARIARVRQSIEATPKDVMLRITHDINKNKGYVFNYNVQEIGSSVHSRLGKAPASSLPEPQIATGPRLNGFQTGFLSPVCLYRSFAIEKEGQETSSCLGKKNHG